MNSTNSIERIITRVLEKKKFCLVIALFAFVGLSLPALSTRLSVDDFIFQSEIIKSQNTFELYNFDKTLKGLKPWWTHEKHKFVLFRPLSSFLIAADYHLFGQNYYLWHMHSVLWGGVFLFGAWCLFNLTLPRKAAGLSTIVLSCSCFIAWPVDYIAQRNHIVAITAGVWALFFYIKWRYGAFKFGRLAAVLAISIGLFGGEYVFTMIMYLLSFEFIESRLSLKKIIPNIWPILIVIACYLIVLKSVNAGTYGMPGYFHPISEPFAFLRNLPGRLLSLLGYLLDLPMAFSRFKETFLSHIVLLIIILTGAYSFQTIRRHRIKNNNFDIDTVYWYAAGMLLSLLPIASTIPRMRLISCGAVGLSALIGLLISNCWDISRQARLPHLVKLVAVYWLFFALIYSPKWCFSTVQWLKNNNRACLQSFQQSIDERSISEDKYTIVARGPSYHCTLILPKICATNNLVPLGYEVLTATHKPIKIDVIDSYSLVITSLDDSLLNAFIGKWFRNPDNGNQFKTGDVADHEIFSARIINMKDGFPDKIKFTFKIPLNSPIIQFVIWEDDRLVPINLPKPDGNALLINTQDNGKLW